MARPHGAKNRRNMKVEEIADKYILDPTQDPFQILLMVAANDFSGLGYPSNIIIKSDGDGGTYEELLIKLSDRVSAAKEAARYLYAQKQAFTVDFNAIHKMDDEQFKAFKAEFLKQYVITHSSK